VEAPIVNKLGLHARAAAKLTHIASGFQCDIWLSRSGRRVNAKSIMGVMMLAAGKGATVRIDAEGADADAALAALTKLIADRFGEGE
jgi:phosphocarrier protein